MVSNNLITQPGYAILGAASDSLVTVVAYAGVVAFLVLIVGVFIGTRSEGALRFLRIKPLLAPSFAFVITLFLVFALVPHPMADYHGLNETSIRYYTRDEPISFIVYDGIAYRSVVQLTAECQIEDGDSITIHVHFRQNDVLVVSTQMTLTGNVFDGIVTEETTVQLEPGRYTADITLSPTADDFSRLFFSQPLTTGFFNEVLAWESYSFGMIAGSFFFILAGLCIGREDKTRFSHEPQDQEPPKDGAAYARQFGA
jgi:hypothetical protein